MINACKKSAGNMSEEEKKFCLDLMTNKNQKSHLEYLDKLADTLDIDAVHAFADYLEPIILNTFARDADIKKGILEWDNLGETARKNLLQKMHCILVQIRCDKGSCRLAFGDTSPHRGLYFPGCNTVKLSPQMVRDSGIDEVFMVLLHENVHHYQWMRCSTLSEFQVRIGYYATQVCPFVDQEYYDKNLIEQEARIIGDKISENFVDKIRNW